jgi:predicted metal-dependent hydrolase
MTSEDSASPPLKGRPVEFDVSAAALYWLGGDAFATHFMNVLHLLLPEGELWFCRIYRQALPALTDSALAEDVRGFIQQEAIHGAAHRGVLDHYFRAMRIDTSAYTDALRWFFGSMLGDQPLGLGIPTRFLRHRWLLFRLGVIAVVEHFTCVLGKWVLENRTLDRAITDAAMLDLLRWHGAEEVEHRHVAHDLFRRMGGGYFYRTGLMLLVAPILLGMWIAGTRYFLEEDRRARQPFSVFVAWQRAAARRLLPSLWLLARAAWRYLRPGYHPRTEADTATALAYLAHSPGVASRRERGDVAHAI